MAYKIYTDKAEDFIAEVSVKNASLKNSIARLIVESSDGLSLVFKGSIHDGKCTVPIKRLKGIMEENSHGTIHLEIIVEDVYFKPWESDFIVEEHTSMKVMVQEQKTPAKPIVEVKVEPTKPVIVEQAVQTPVAKQTSQPEILDPKKPTHVDNIPEVTKPTLKKEMKNMVKGKEHSNPPVYPSDELVSICESLKIKKKDLNKNLLQEVLTEYFNINKEFIPNRNAIAKQFLKKIK